jgi:hypothetical protein
MNLVQISGDARGERFVGSSVGYGMLALWGKLIRPR